MAKAQCSYFSVPIPILLARVSSEQVRIDACHRMSGEHDKRWRKLDSSSSWQHNYVTISQNQ